MIGLLLGIYFGGFFVSLCWSISEAANFGVSTSPVAHVTATAIWPLVMAWLVVEFIRRLA